MQSYYGCTGPRRLRVGKTVVFRGPFGRIGCKIRTVLSCGVVNAVNSKHNITVDVYGYDFKKGTGTKIVICP